MFKKIFQWILVTFASAVIGAAITFFVQRAHPSVSIVDVGILESPPTNSKIIEVPRSDPTVRSLSESAWVDSIREAEMPLNDFRSTLADGIERADKFLKHVAEFQEVLPKLEQLLAGPSNQIAAESYFDLWEP